jgi:uncharacterized protein (TIGR02246 family)
LIVRQPGNPLQVFREVSMKGTIRSAAFLLAFLSLGSTRAIAQAVLPDSAVIAAEIHSLMKKYADAVRTHDLEAFDSLIAPDLMNIRPNGDRHSKTEVLAILRSGRQKFTKYQPGWTQVNVYTNDVAVAVTQLEVEGPSHTGTPLMNHNVTTRVWVKRHGRWQVVLNSITDISGPSPK